VDKLFAIFPKNVLAFLLIAGGILFIVLSQPPHSVCDSQMEVVNRNQLHFLFKDPKSKAIKTTKYETLRDHCKLTNNPGGCYELFQELKTMVYDLRTLSSECSAAISGTSEYKRALWDSAEMMVRLAWGEKPPSSYSSKLGWLEVADVSLFCRMRELLVAFYGDSAWESFRERLMKDLPGARELNRNQVWELSLFSENCARYP
jgi:hypothetical protein